VVRSLIGTVAVAGQDGRWDDADAAVRAERSQDGWQLTGTRWYVLAGPVTGICVVPAVSASGLGLYAGETVDARVVRQPVPDLPVCHERREELDHVGEVP
jgi:alkylation response protein AidB-like acyl-CoA dehydrogenase